MSFNNNADAIVLTYPMIYVRDMPTGHLSFRVMEKSQYLEMLNAAGVNSESKSFLTPVNVGYTFKAKVDQKVFPDDFRFVNKEWYEVTFRVKPWELETDECDVKGGKWAQIISAEPCDDPTQVIPEIITPAAVKTAGPVTVSTSYDSDCNSSFCGYGNSCSRCGGGSSFYR